MPYPPSSLHFHYISLCRCHQIRESVIYLWSHLLKQGAKEQSLPGCPRCVCTLAQLSGDVRFCISQPPMKVFTNSPTLVSNNSFQRPNFDSLFQEPILCVTAWQGCARGGDRGGQWSRVRLWCCLAPSLTPSGSALDGAQCPAVVWQHPHTQTVPTLACSQRAVELWGLFWPQAHTGACRSCTHRVHFERLCSQIQKRLLQVRASCW